MTVALVIGFFALAVAIDALVVRRLAARRAERLVRPPADELIEPDSESSERLFHQGHTWVELRQAAVSVGMDEFARRLIGRIDAIELPSPGAWIEKGRPLWRVRFGNRELSQRAPLSGRVLEVNRASDAADWLVRLLPQRLDRDLRELYSAARFAKWTELQQDRFIRPAFSEVGPVYADGGELIEGAARQLSDEQWRELTRHVFYIE